MGVVVRGLGSTWIFGPCHFKQIVVLHTASINHSGTYRKYTRFKNKSIFIFDDRRIPTPRPLGLKLMLTAWSRRSSKYMYIGLATFDYNQKDLHLAKIQPKKWLILLYSLIY